MNRPDALKAVQYLVQTHGLTAAEIFSSTVTPEPATSSRARDVLSRLASYIGGIFVFAGLITFVGMQWDDMSSLMRVLVTLGLGCSVHIAMLVTSADARFLRVQPVLILTASFLQTTGLLVLMHEYMNTGNDPRYAALMVTVIMLMQQLVTLVARPAFATLVFLALFYALGAYATICDLLDIKDKYAIFLAGASLLGLASALTRTRYASVTPFWFFIGAVGASFGAWDMLGRTPAEILYSAFATGLIYLSTQVQSRGVLLVGTLSLLGYIGYFTAENFANSIGWPIALVLIGGAFIGIGATAMKINRKYISS